MIVHRLQIEQQIMQIRASTQLASLSINIPQRRMKVERQNAEMTIDKQSSDIALDMRDFRNNNGIKDIASFARDYTAKANAHVSQSISQMASDGNYIATLPSGVNEISQLSRIHMLEVVIPESPSGNLPYGSVKMEGDPGSFSINWSSHDLKIEWDDFQTPQITVQPKPSVQVNVIQEPYIKYRVIELEIPAEKGRTIDTEA